MATQTRTTTQTLADRTELRLKASENQPAYSDEQMSYIDTAIQRTGSTINWAATRAKATLDAVVPPEQSNAAVKRTQNFAKANPKLAAFLFLNIVLSGVPLLLFTAFSLSVLVFSIVTGIILGLIGALLFTSSVVGVALVFLVPTVLLTTLVAITLFFWSVVGLYIYVQIEQRRKR